MTVAHPVHTDPRPYYAERLAWLAALKQGWSDGEAGKPIPQRSLDCARETLDMLADDRPVWSIGPIEEGGLHIEQSQVTRSHGTIASVEIDADGSLLTHVLGLAGHGDAETRFHHEATALSASHAVDTVLGARDRIRTEIAEQLDEVDLARSVPGGSA